MENVQLQFVHEELKHITKGTVQNVNRVQCAFYYVGSFS